MSSNSSPDPNPQESGLMFDQFNLEKIELEQSTSSNKNISGWFVKSTALNNVEEPTEDLDEEVTKDHLIEIAKHLFNASKKSEDSEVIISIHGYANHTNDKGGSAAKDRYRKTHEYISSCENIDKSMHVVFLGYLWPSEKLFYASGKNPRFLALKNAFEAAPGLLKFLFSKSLFLFLFSYFCRSHCLQFCQCSW